MNGKFTAQGNSQGKAGQADGKRKGWRGGRVKIDTVAFQRGYKITRAATLLFWAAALLHYLKLKCRPTNSGFNSGPQMCLCSFLSSEGVGQWKPFWRTGTASCRLWGNSIKVQGWGFNALCCMFSYFTLQSDIDSPAAAHASDFISLAQLQNSIS